MEIKDNKEINSAKVIDFPRQRQGGIGSQNNEWMVLLLFFMSGMSALIYEVAWLNRLQLIMGHTIYALTTTLAAYLGGLALGSWWAQRLIARGKSALYLYLLFELLIGLYGIGFFPILRFMHFLYAPFVSNSHLPLLALSALQFIFCGLVIMVPTLLMGATLPLLGQHLYRDRSTMARKVPSLYAINTLGAFVGCLLAGYLLLPSLGYQKSIYFCAGINVLLFLVASVSFADFRPTWQGFWQEIRPSGWGGNGSLPREQAHIDQQGQHGRWNWQKVSRREGSLLLLLLVSGFSSLWVQLLWNRLAQLNFGPTSYIFPLMTSVILLGIFGGGMLVRKYSGEQRGLIHFLLLDILLTAPLFLLGNALFAQTPLLILYLHQSLSSSIGFWFLSFLQFAWSLVCLLPASIGLGAIFPAGLSLLLWQEKKEISGESNLVGGQIIGLGYGINILGVTMGAIAGSIAMPLLKIDGLNQTVFILLCLCFCGLGIGLKKGRHLVLAGLVFLLCGLLMNAPFDRPLLFSGYFYNRIEKMEGAKLLELGHLDLRAFHEFNKVKIVDFADDIHGSISIHESWEDQQSRWFKFNGKVDGSIGISDQKTNGLLTYFPLMVRHDYQDVLTIGLGTGMSANLTSGLPQLKSSTVVELSPAMVQFSRKYFNTQGSHIWTDPRFQLINRDGREFLLHTKNKYDLIISEPSNPWVDGVASLFTQEYFQLVSQRLNPGGIASIWFHSYGLECHAVHSVFMALARAFSYFEIYRVSNDYYVLASNQPFLKKLSFPAGMAKEEGNFFEYLNLISDFHHSPTMAYEQLKSGFFVADRQRILKYDNWSLVNTDDNQLLQFQSGRSYWTAVACPAY